MSAKVISGIVQGLQPSPHAAVVVNPIIFATGAEDYQFSSDGLPGQQKALGAIETMFVDTSAFASGKTVTIKTPLQTFQLQGGNQGYFPVCSPMPFTLEVTSQDGVSTGTVQILLLNFAVTPGQQQNILQATISGILAQNLSQISGANITLGQKVMASSLPVVLPSDQTVVVQQAVSSVAYASSNAKTTVKAAAGLLTGLTLGNNNAAVSYLQIFDALAAAVNVGVTPPKMSVMIPANGSLSREFVRGISFATGIVFAVTTTPAGGAAPATACDVNIDFV